MARNMTINQLTEGIRERHLGTDRNRLVEKWTRTGLLRGMDDHNRETMSQLLENQAAQLLREANTLGSNSGANIDGFSNIAFPIVRRVFGGLVANELVSIQPMSLPSGLLFYLDYTYGSPVGNEDDVNGNDNFSNVVASKYKEGSSLYGSPAGRDVRTGVDAVGGQYDLAGSGYSKVNKSCDIEGAGSATAGSVRPAETGNNGSDSVGAYNSAGTWVAGALLTATDKNLKLIQYDPQVLKEINEGTQGFQLLFFDINSLTDIDRTMAKEIAVVSTAALSADFDTFADQKDSDDNLYQDCFGFVTNLRRLNQIGTWSPTTATFTPDPVNGNQLMMVTIDTAKVGHASSDNLDTVIASSSSRMVYILDEAAAASAAGGVGSTFVIPAFETTAATFGGATPAPIIPEIDIKIESIAVTAATRKLRARWSPELAQDLNAYHSLDAEVELTQILSEQIALEIDREILNDLLVEAKGANFFWSRAPGKFVNKRSGAAQNLASSLATGPQFTGTVREWYETLVETIIDVGNEIHRKTLRGSANFIVVSPEVATIFEASVLYKPTIKIDGQGQTGPQFSIGAQAIGSLSNRFTVYKDPYFPRNKILVGYKGGSYLETGYVYAPYVPLIVTPTLFAPEDFTPRKGVMTRYGKKMVRADFYGTVTCLDMDII